MTNVLKIAMLPRNKILLSLISAFIIMGIIYWIDSKKKETGHLENLEYSEQVRELADGMRSTAEQLLSFADNQKKKLQETEDTILKLEAEKEKLRSAIAIDKDNLDAIFRLQEERVKVNIGYERWIGFFLGVGASLFASLIWSAGRRISVIIRNKNKRRSGRSKSEEEPPNPSREDENNWLPKDNPFN